MNGDLIKRTFTTRTPDKPGAFMRACKVIKEQGGNITRVSYKRGGLNLFIEVEGTKGVLADPAPFARFSGCAENAQEFTLRAWCATGDYWDVYFDLLQNVSAAFGQAGIAAPATKLDVTLDK